MHNLLTSPSNYAILKPRETVALAALKVLGEILSITAPYHRNQSGKCFRRPTEDLLIGKLMVQ